MNKLCFIKKIKSYTFQKLSTNLKIYSGTCTMIKHIVISTNFNVSLALYNISQLIQNFRPPNIIKNHTLNVYFGLNNK